LDQSNGRAYNDEKNVGRLHGEVVWWDKVEFGVGRLYTRERNVWRKYVMADVTGVEIESPKIAFALHSRNKGQLSVREVPLESPTPPMNVEPLRHPLQRYVNLLLSSHAYAS
jgi:hypothetical protein